MGDRQSVEAIFWLAFVGLRSNDVTHAGNGREVLLAGVHNWEVDGYCAETNELFITSNVLLS